MTDNDNPPTNYMPINEPPSKEEIEEKNYNEDNVASAPIAVNPALNNNTPQYYNPPYPPQNNAQQINQAYPTQAPYYPPPNYNNNMNYNPNYNNNYYTNGAQYPYVPPVPPKRYSRFQSPKCAIFLSIVLISVFVIDLLLQAALDMFNYITFIDDIAILVMGLILLILTCKGKSLSHIGLGAATIIVWFVGFGVRGFGMTQFEKPVMVIINFFLLVARTFALFFLIPQTCNQQS